MGNSRRSAARRGDHRRCDTTRNGGRLLARGTGHGPHKTTTIVRNAAVQALRDPRGGSCAEFFVRLKQKKPEVFANVIAKLIPIEVAGSVGTEALTVLVQTYVAAPNGERLQVPLDGRCDTGRTR